MNHRQLILTYLVLLVSAVCPSLAQPSDPFAVCDSGTCLSVRFDNLSASPVQDTDFEVTFNGSHVPTVTLLRGASGSTVYQWRVWCKDGSNNPKDIATIQATANYHFDVKVLNASDGPGAATVGGISLLPASSSYYSRITGGNFVSLSGAVRLQQSGGGDGGDATGLVIGGSNPSIPAIDTDAELHIPVLAAPLTGQTKSLDIKQEIKGHVTIDLMQEDSVLDMASISEGGSLDIDEMDEAYIGGTDDYIPVAGTVNIDTLGDEAFAYFGPFDTTASVYVGEMGHLSALYLTNFTEYPDATGASVTIDRMDDGATFSLACFCENNDPPMALTVNSIGDDVAFQADGPGTHGTFDIGSIGSSGLTIDVVRGLVTLENGIPAGAEVDVSNLKTSGVIDLNNSAIAGTLSVTQDCFGTVTNGGNVSGIVNLSHPYAVFHGNAAFSAASGQINTGRVQGGTLTVTGNLTGTIATHGDVAGAINVDSDIGAYGVIHLLGVDGLETSDALGNLAGGTINVGGDSQGSITLPGMTGSASIVVTGKQSGTITVFNQMSSGSTVHAVAGLDSGAATSINAYGDSGSTTSGLIWYGGSSSATPYSTLTFDGSVAINDCDGGTFTGTVKIVGCALTNHRHANICINGVNSGTISYYSSRCTYGFSTHCAGPCGS